MIEKFEFKSEGKANCWIVQFKHRILFLLNLPFIEQHENPKQIKIKKKTNVLWKPT